MPKHREKSTIPRHFLGIFEIFRGGKGTPDHQSRKKFYLVNILSTHQSRQLCLEGVFFQFFSIWEITIFAKNSKSGGNAKGQSWKI
jgi:hypothetical protein